MERFGIVTNYYRLSYTSTTLSRRTPLRVDFSYYLLSWAAELVPMRFWTQILPTALLKLDLFLVPSNNPGDMRQINRLLIRSTLL